MPILSHVSQEIKYFEFSIKGYFPSVFMDRLSSWGYADITTRKSFGRFIFKGTIEESERFEDEVFAGGEAYYKLIGVRSFKEQDYNPENKLIFTKTTKQLCKQNQTLPLVR